MTLTENSTVSNPIYLFLFINQQNNQKYYFIASDTSAFKQRFNQFSINETPNSDTLNGEVSLGNEGFYDYAIYETDLTSTSGLTNAEDAVSHIVKSVEVGLVWVVPVADTNTQYSPQASNTIVYQSEDMLLLESGEFILTEDNYFLVLE